ncbi:MAG: TetR/AcrR family transcriptional regulator [Intrasporangium sp.]|uniref:TetR/AcrR family transcriptional regulator n=1 Tax=Intrasporangium sp. TaxID=1925024 RepID=UPI0026486259|nr:TetR/AcrR family transcriptional regulator [Intrasporangium sp.]MDN5797334.1 TetR/AcrR family transcriptional regulator [Intrasporangium sp.]
MENRGAGTLGPSRPLRADAQRNYQRIVAAGREVFRRSGTEASLEEVARVAGVGIGTLYRRFPGRLALLEAVYREDVDTLEHEVDRLLESEEPWAAVVRWSDLLLDYAATKRALFHALADAVETDSELLTHSRRVVGDSTARVLRRAQQAGVVRPEVEPSDLLRLLGGCTMMGGLDDDQRHRIAEIVLAGIRAPEPA